MQTNQIICGSALEELKKLPDGSVNCSISSPPYWALRAYGTNPQIWGGDEKCEHKWGKDIVQKKSGGTEKTNIGNFKDDRIHYESKTQFCSKCGAWRGELGLEPDYNLYLDHLVAIYDEVFRVLRPDGCCFVNIGDTYGTHTQKRTGQLGIDIDSPANRLFLQKRPNVGLEKSLCLIPQRFAIKMLEHKWVLRNWINWAKPNPMPSSAKDRFTCDSEPVLMFVKSNETQHWVRPDGKMSLTKPDHKAGKEGLDWQWGIRKGKKVKLSLWQGWSYYFEPQYEPHKYPEDNNRFAGLPKKGIIKENNFRFENRVLNPLGRNKRTTWEVGDDYEITVKQNGQLIFAGSGKLPETMVEQIYKVLTQQNDTKTTTWTIPTESFSEAHFATFPKKLVEPMILAGCPEFVCTKCGAPRKKVYKPTPEYAKHLGGKGFSKSNYRFKGYSFCGCNADYKPGICLDPFAGSLTTAVVCDYLDRDYVMIELSKEYIKIGKRRIGRAQGKHYISGETQLSSKEQQQGQKSLFEAK